jgi:5-methylcytosine-specific restriction endonuclease McrA
MLQTLILNLDFTPMSVVSWRRGIVLSLNNKNLRVLEYYDLTVGSEYDIFEVPAVMLYQKFVKPPKRRTISKHYVLLRDKMTCQYCAKKLDELTSSVDHVIPVSRFSTKVEANTWDNLVACCKSCNTKKRNRTPQEARMSLVREPRQPSGFLHINTAPAVWKDYISNDRIVINEYDGSKGFFNT